MIVSVKHRGGWCATSKVTLKYADSIRTLCRHYVVAPWGIEHRQPDCPECLRILARRVREEVEK